jgi:adenine-specific DNA-methyltransferase
VPENLFSKTTRPNSDGVDTPHLRKARGAYFTPPALARFMTDWAVRGADDRLLEPSCGDAEFLVHAVTRLRELGARNPEVAGVEIHAESAATARARVLDAGGEPDVRVSDFFTVAPAGGYDAVVGNPPYIRYQEFTGAARAAAQAATGRAGVGLSGRASSWAAFTVHATQFLAPGGRMALVVPAELLSVGYAAPVRAFLLDGFASLTLVTFEEQVFVDADVDVVLLLADGWQTGAAADIIVRHAQNGKALARDLPSRTWVPVDRAAKWTPALMGSDTLAVYASVTGRPDFAVLEAWGDTKLGAVTGSNEFFALTPRQVAELGLERDVVPLSPPKSAHLRGLELSTGGMDTLARNGAATFLFRPGADPSSSALAYVAAGEAGGVHTAYKCRKRATWWRVPVLRPADLLITCMNTHTPRIVTNSAGVHHLNSVHGIYLRPAIRELGRSALALASLNSVTLLGAEIVGRAYGGGLLKLEPGEARLLPVPSPELVQRVAKRLNAEREEIGLHLQNGQLLDAVAVVDDILLVGGLGMSRSEVALLRRGRETLARRRAAKGQTVATS